MNTFHVDMTPPPAPLPPNRFYAATKLEQMVLLAAERGASPDDVTSGLSVKELSEIARSELDDEVTKGLLGWCHSTQCDIVATLAQQGECLVWWLIW